MKQPCTCDFGVEHGFNLHRGDFLKWGRAQIGGHMNNTAQRGQVVTVSKPLEEFLHRGGIGDVGMHDREHNAGCPKIVDLLLPCDDRGLRACGQNQMTCSLAAEPRSDTKTEASHSAGEQIAHIFSKNFSGREQIRCSWLSWLKTKSFSLTSDINNLLFAVMRQKLTNDDGAFFFQRCVWVQIDDALQSLGMFEGGTASKSPEGSLHRTGKHRIFSAGMYAFCEDRKSAFGLQHLAPCIKASFGKGGSTLAYCFGRNTRTVDAVRGRQQVMRFDFDGTQVRNRRLPVLDIQRISDNTSTLTQRGHLLHHFPGQTCFRSNHNPITNHFALADCRPERRGLPSLLIEPAFAAFCCRVFSRNGPQANITGTGQQNAVRAANAYAAIKAASVSMTQVCLDKHFATKLAVKAGLFNPGHQPQLHIAFIESRSAEHLETRIEKSGMRSDRGIVKDMHAVVGSHSGHGRSGRKPDFLHSAKAVTEMNSPFVEEPVKLFATDPAGSLPVKRDGHIFRVHISVALEAARRVQRPAAFVQSARTDTERCG